MAEAHLRWTAQTDEAKAQILALKAVIDSIGGGSSGGGIRKVSSDVSKLGRDTETAGKKIERAFADIPKSLDKFGKGLSGPFGILKPLGLLFQLSGKLGGVLETAGKWLGNLGADGEQAAGAFVSMGSSMGPLLAAAGPVVAILVALGGALLILPGLVGAATFVLYALLEALTTLTAVVAAFVAPLTVVTALLGGLGAAFAYVASQSFKNKASLKDQHDALLQLHVAQQTYNADLAKYGSSATQTEKALIALHAAQDKYAKAQEGVSLGTLDLSGKFQKLVATLSRDFQPEIIALGQAAATALTFLGKIAKLPLAEAFHQLATKGVAMLSKFMYGVGHALAAPFRLAISTAFGGSSWMQGAMSKWWDSFTHYLFGYVKTKRIELRPGKFGFTKQTIDGALQPILDWFNRQHFTAQGGKWANEIWNGIKNSKAWASFKAFIEQVASDAGTKAGAAFRAKFLGELGSLYSSIQNLLNPGAGIVNGLLGGTGSTNSVPYTGGRTPNPSGGQGSVGGGGGPHGVHHSSVRTNTAVGGHVMTVLVPHHEVRRLMRAMDGQAARLA
jgi:hypothetical protein